MGDNQDEQKFNETLKRMLETPPKPDKKGARNSDDNKQRNGNSESST